MLTCELSVKMPLSFCDNHYINERPLFGTQNSMHALNSANLGTGIIIFFFIPHDLHDIDYHAVVSEKTVAIPCICCFSM